MESNIQPDRERLESMIDDNTDEGALRPELRRRLMESRAYIASGGKGTPMEEVLAEFGLSMDDFSHVAALSNQCEILTPHRH